MRLWLLALVLPWVVSAQSSLYDATEEIDDESIVFFCLANRDECGFLQEELIYPRFLERLHKQHPNEVIEIHVLDRCQSEFKLEMRDEGRVRVFRHPVDASELEGDQKLFDHLTRYVKQVAGCGCYVFIGHHNTPGQFNSLFLSLHLPSGHVGTLVSNGSTPFGRIAQHFTTYVPTQAELAERERMLLDSQEPLDRLDWWDLQHLANLLWSELEEGWIFGARPHEVVYDIGDQGGLQLQFEARYPDVLSPDRLNRYWSRLKADILLVQDGAPNAYSYWPHERQERMWPAYLEVLAKQFPDRRVQCVISSQYANRSASAECYRWLLEGGWQCTSERQHLQFEKENRRITVLYGDLNYQSLEPFSACVQRVFERGGLVFLGMHRSSASVPRAFVDAQANFPQTVCYLSVGMIPFSSIVRLYHQSTVDRNELRELHQAGIKALEGKYGDFTAAFKAYQRGDGPLQRAMAWELFDSMELSARLFDSLHEIEVVVEETSEGALQIKEIH